MCRLLAVVAPGPSTVAQVLGPDGPEVFQDMARLHRDGWGTAWVGDGVVRRHRSVASGADDAALTRTMATDRSSARVMHLRLASDGMACSTENTHPFLADGIAFAHNGAVIPERRMDDLIAPDLLAGLEGETDTERYFAVLRSAARELGDLEAGVLAGVARIRERFPTASMNAMLLTETVLVVIHASRDAPIPVDDFEGFDRLPAGHDDSYYRMHVRREADGSLAFASSGLDVADWDELPPESVTFVDLATLSVRTMPIETQSPVVLTQKAGRLGVGRLFA